MFLYNESILAEYITIDGEKTDYIICSNGDIIGKRFKKPLKGNPCKEGYLQVKLSTKNNGEVMRYIHRLVAEYFIPNPNNKPEVNHKDGDKTKNNIENLEWVTREENIQHAFRLGLKKNLFGNDHPRSICTEKSAHEICELLEENMKTISEISKITNTSIDIVRNILRHNSWNHISKYYNIDDYCVDGRKMTYTYQQLIYVCKLLEENKLSREEISDLTKVHIDTIGRIIRKESYINISKDYNIERYNVRPLPKNISTDIMTYIKIKELINDGYTNEEIINKVKLEDTRKVRQRISKMRERFKK